MNVAQPTETVKPSPSLPKYRVGEKVFNQSWEELNVSNKKGWRCVKVGDKWVGISSLPDKTGDTYPVYWDYVFGDAWQRYNNFWYNHLLNLKSR